MREEEKLELGVVTEKQDAQAIRDAIKEAEEELGVSSHANIEELPRDRSISGMNAFLLVIATAFATSFAKKFGESFADWLAHKLGLDQSKGEEVTESV